MFKDGRGVVKIRGESNDNESMKKFIAVIALMIASGFVFAGGFISTIWSAGTSALFYGDPAIEDLNDNLKKQDYLNVVATGEYGVTVQLDDKIDFVGFAYLTLEDYSKKKSAILYLDYGVSGGVRLYPGLGGIALGCEYCTGQRADVNSLGEGKAEWSTTQWGNGYRLLFEYDFSALLTGIAPVLGVSFRSVPRGNNYNDKNLAFYFRLLS